MEFKNKIFVCESYAKDDKSLFAGKELSGCVFDGCTFENIEILNAFARNSSVVFKKCIFKKVSFTGCDFPGARIESCEFLKSKLNSTDFSKSHLYDVDMPNMQMRRVDLTGTVLSNVQLTSARCEKVKFDRSIGINVRDFFRLWFRPKLTLVKYQVYVGGSQRGSFIDFCDHEYKKLVFFEDAQDSTGRTLLIPNRVFASITQS